MTRHESKELRHATCARVDLLSNSAENNSALIFKSIPLFRTAISLVVIRTVHRQVQIHIPSSLSIRVAQYLHRVGLPLFSKRLRIRIDPVARNTHRLCKDSPTASQPFI